MNKKYWVLGTPDGGQFFGMPVTLEEMGASPNVSLPFGAVMVFASDAIAREAIKYFRLPSALYATPWRLETERDFNDFLQNAWSSGTRELLIVEKLTCNPRRMEANLYSFFDVGIGLSSEGGGGKSSLARWLFTPKDRIHWS